MNALLERLKANRRFARSVYAPHKLALRQGVPSVLRSAGVTEPAAPVTKASRTINPRVTTAEAAPPIVTVEGSARSAAQRSSTQSDTQLVSPASPEQAPLTPLEAQVLDAVSLESASSEHAAPDPTLEAPIDLDVSGEPQSVDSDDGDGVADEPLEAHLEMPSLEALVTEPSDLASRAQSEQRATLEPGLEAAARPVLVSEVAPLAPTVIPARPESPADAPESQPDRVKFNPPLESAIETPRPLLENAPVRAPSPASQPEMIPAAPVAREDPALPPDQSNPEAQVATLPPEPDVSPADLEVMGDPLPESTLPVSALPHVAPLHPASAEEGQRPTSALSGLEENTASAAPPLHTSSSPAAAPSLELNGSSAPETNQPAASGLAVAPTPPTARGRVIEEFQARPPRNMPPRNPTQPQPTPRAAEPEPIIEAAVSEAPRRSSEEWARLLRQRFAQPGDEAFDDAPPLTKAELTKAEALEVVAAPSNPPVIAPNQASEPRSAAPAIIERGGAASSSLAITDESDGLSAQAIRDRAQAALQAIPEDMSQRTPRDWGLALIRRYASVEEAEAIGIEAYRDPNDPTPIPALVKVQPKAALEPTRGINARTAQPAAAADGVVASSTTATSLARQPAQAGLNEQAASPTRRFIAPRLVSPDMPSSRVMPSNQNAQAPASFQTVSPPLDSASLDSAPLASAAARLEVARAMPAPIAEVSIFEPTTSAAAPQLQPLESSEEASPDSVGNAFGSVNPTEVTLERDSATSVLAHSGTAPAEPEGEAARLEASAQPKPMHQNLGDREAQGSAPANVQEVAQQQVTDRRAPPGFNDQTTVAGQPSAALETQHAAPFEPVRLSGATRRFLEPLIGFDPNEVSVYTGEGASRVARDLRADAAAQDGAVLLPDASNLETPAQLGLLAHELIHVAEQQQSGATRPAAPLEPVPESRVEPAAPEPAFSNAPAFHPLAPRRFVAAVGSSDTRGATPISTAAQPISPSGQFNNESQFSNAVRQSRAPINDGISSFASEEDRARTAEARVTQIARDQPLSAAPNAVASAGWNGLPAPWEALPSLESRTSSEQNVVSLIGAGLSPQSWGAAATTTNPSSSGSTSGYGGAVSSAPSSSGSSSAGGGQAAEIGRELPAEGSGGAGGPDLETLAKQVYDVLKRRLQSDRRRGGL